MRRQSNNKIKKLFLWTLLTILVAVVSFKLITSNDSKNSVQNTNQVMPSAVNTAESSTDTTANKANLNQQDANSTESQTQKVDFTELNSQLTKALGDKVSKYTIYLEDLSTNQSFNINEGKIVEPASIAKLPVAVLIMRDVDAKKITLEDTYPLKNSEKFGNIGNLGNLPDGTPVSFRTYLENLLEHSDNNAWYALVHFLGNSYEVVNPRIINELGVNPLFLDPAQGTAENVGKVLSQIYSAKTVSKESSDYLISLMEKADEWAKAGIGLGLPEGTRFANKIGTLDADGKVSYQDAAIVWGTKTTYVLVIMDENIGWGEGQTQIKELSKIVYDYLN